MCAQSRPSPRDLKRRLARRAVSRCGGQYLSLRKPLVDRVARHIELVSERFAQLLHMTLSLALDDLPASHEPLLMQGLPVAEYVQKVDYRRIVRALLRFQVARDPTDLTSLFALVLVYLRQMKTKTALPLLEQMVAWFDAPNVIYCVAFLSHVWLQDDALPLREWHGLTEGVARGVNLNKCVRNVLRILKYRLFVTQTQARAALLSLEYSEETRQLPASGNRARLTGESERSYPEKRPVRPKMTTAVVRRIPSATASTTASSSAPSSETSSTTPEEPRFQPREREAARAVRASRARRADN